ncbi:MAG: hypothetical protein HONBIEJF_00162 [Fimbriimonadaceae bacterium]|nr:hypothetical protein [Fimbriimonadaceae bacterium]
MSVPTGIRHYMAQEGITADIREMAWLQGSWICEVWDGAWHEAWSGPSGNTMQGHGKHIRDGSTAFMEYMSIEPTADGGLNLWMLLGAPSKGRKMGVPFRLVKSNEEECVWANPANEFPSTIVYRKTADGMLCRIAGRRGGQEESTGFNFRPLKD